MENKSRQLLFTAINAVFFLLLLFLSSVFKPTTVDILALFLFGTLASFTMFHGIKLVGGMVSLLPLVGAAAYLVIGPLLTAWIFFAAAWIKGVLSYFFPDWTDTPAAVAGKAELLERTAVNATMVPAGILFGGLVYTQLASFFSLENMGYPVFILFWGVGYFFINYLFVLLYLAAKSRVQLRQFWQTMYRPLLYEAVPLPFASLVARIYTDLGGDYFLFLMLAIVFMTFIVRHANEIGLSLNRRVMELNSLKHVGQTLNAGLEIDSILAAIHTQVARLMPAQTFYIALYDEARQEVSFPFVVEDDERKEGATRCNGRGLVEYVLRQQRPLLITKDVVDTAVRLGLNPPDREPVCWLGVPIMLADGPIGAIVVQSYAQSGLYDDWHQDVLLTIATQAAMAIENGRLYAQTGSELARRVRELNSILSTIHEGILLVSPQGNVITTNRVFAEFVGAADDEWVGQSLFAEEANLLTQIGYDRAGWEEDCLALRQNGKWRTSRVVMPEPNKCQVERTLVPVRDEGSMITGWLLTFRDISEEIEMAKMREETIHMLVHDLRSPLSVTLGSLQTIDAWLGMGRMDDVRRLLDLAHNGGQRMLQILNNLLDAYKFENGSVPLNIEPMPVLPWLTDVKAQFTPTASSAGLTILVEVESGLPMLGVDKDHMMRVLSNLVDNAVKFTPDGGQIKLWARHTDDKDNPILVGVSDTGQGIPPEEQERLFIKFQQNIAARGRRQGTGLGLTYCKLVVEAHNGRIWVESEGVEGKGSTFLMSLPVFDAVRSPKSNSQRKAVLNY